MSDAIVPGSEWYNRVKQTGGYTVVGSANVGADRQANQLVEEVVYTIDGHPGLFTMPLMVWTRGMKVMVKRGVDPQASMVEQFRVVQDECLAIFRRKNAAYGDSFITGGVFGIVVRLLDKFQRAATLMGKGGDQADESIDDTLRDAHNYCAMALMLRRYPGMVGPSAQGIAADAMEQLRNDNARLEAELEKLKGEER